MGIRNSTITRVEPLMNSIGNNIEQINILFSLLPKMKQISKGDKIIEICYGNNEKKICPKQELLEWYVNNVAQLTKVKNYGTKSLTTRKNRELLFNNDETKKKEAINLIRKNPKKEKVWYIFEGYTQPDIYIETNESIYIGEAKRTEEELTTSTQWLSPRDQLIRHADSVIDSNKNVYIFFIIDKSKENIYKLERYNNEFSYYKASLPHRKDSDVIKIMNSYCGYTTWDDITNILGIHFPDTIYDIEDK